MSFLEHSTDSPTPKEPGAGFRQSRRSVIGLLGASALAAGGAVAASGYAGAGESTATARIPRDLLPGGALDQLISQLAAEDRFSGTVLLLHRNRPVLSRSVGLAERTRKIPNKADTIFALGSITKLFTAVAIAQLVQRGKVAYHGTVGSYLDGFPPEVADTVTVHQLLTHTSGVGRPAAGPLPWDPAWSSVKEVWTRTMEIVRQTPLRFTPGSRHEYSNDGYFLLGAIVAKVTNRPYYDYVREHVFGPAGMTRTDFPTRPQWLDDRRIAHPYTNLLTRPPSAERVDTINQHAFIGGPADGAFSTTADLGRFARALVGGRLLDAAHTPLLLAPKLPLQPQQPPAPDKPPLTPFATYAPMATLVSGQWTYGHTGGSHLGISTSLDWYPTADWVTVLLSNYENSATMPIGALTRRLIVQ